jgi:threonine dehydrogenase-like Zn-dependent dehydrogenase
MTDGVGVDCALECVGTGESLATAMAIARPGSLVGAIGAPHHIDFPIMDKVVYGNIGLRGGVAPARAYIPELLDDVLAGRINPGLVFDYETDLEHVEEAYRAMDERRAIKSLLRIGTV